MDTPLTQSSFIYEYNDTHREKFNEELFDRNEDDIIEELKKVILSCEKDKYFTIKVLGFQVVDDYEEILNLLNEQRKLKPDKKNPTKDYSAIVLKDSDVKLLVVDYFIKVKNSPDKTKKTEKNLRVLIEVPRIVDRYYMRIRGNVYTSMYQVVDGSTYNNSQSNSKKQNISFKSLFMATRIFRYIVDIKSTKGEHVKCTYYYSNIFDKSVPAMRYILAKYGFYGTCILLMCNYITIHDEDPEIEDNYTFKKAKVYVSVPKFIFDNDHIVQSFVYTILDAVHKDDEAKDIFTLDYWLMTLASNFGSKDKEKAYGILDSLELIYDQVTEETLRLPEDNKKDIYDILIWLLREFPNLRLKDNLNVGTKYIRWSKYFAAMYANKLANGLRRINEDSDKLELIRVEQAIYTAPDFLLKTLTSSKDKLVNYKNSVNDLDAINALKFTYKGISGLGDEKSSSVARVYKQVHPSHIGRIDMDNCSSSDVGLSGLLCPLVKMNGEYFSDYQEPNSWREETAELLKQYREMKGLKQVIEFKESVGIPVDDDQKERIEDTLDNIGGLIKPIEFLCKEEFDAYNSSH